MEDAFPIVVVLGLAIFGMVWIGSQADGFNISNGSEPQSRLLLDAEPGTVGSTNEDFRSIGFGTFTVGETRGDIQAYTSEKDTISNGLISGNRVKIKYNATQPGQGQVNFEILGRKAKGEIFVKVNGREAFKAAAITNSEPEINISQEYFNTGINKIVIGTTQPNPLNKAVYALEDIEVTVEDRKFHDHTTYFQVYDHELEGFRPSNLTFQIPVDESIPQEPLNIEVNDKTVFSRVIGRSTQGVTITPQNSDLSTGYNTINFGTEGESKYGIRNAQLQVRYAVNVRPAQKTFNFELSEEALNYVRRDKTEERLSFTYQKTTTAEPLQISLNNRYQEIEPENGVNTIEVNDENLERENTLTISSNRTFTAQNLQMVSRLSE